IEALQSGGRSLSANERAFLEPRFGHDLGEVRVHEGGEAAALNQELGARAFVVGHTIALGGGDGRGDSTDARRLLAPAPPPATQRPGARPRGAGPAAPAGDGAEPPAPAPAARMAPAAATPGCAARQVQRFGWGDLNPLNALKKAAEGLLHP